MIFDQSIREEYRISDTGVNNQSDIILYHNCDMTTLGQRVKARRKELGMTQEELASKSGVSQTTISDMERGRNSTSREIALLARTLQSSAYWLATGKGIDAPDQKDPPPAKQLSPAAIAVAEGWQELPKKSQDAIAHTIETLRKAKAQENKNKKSSPGDADSSR